ncbi:MAG TPA: response regulator transcription factor [Aggregatilineales bacterium]|nr:response regulator transcription factor [Aggregatilineales bacterium]
MDSIQKPNSPIRVMIVEDHPLFRDGLEKALSHEADLQVVGFASTGQEAIDSAQTYHPHVVLLDVNLPDMNGLQVARHLLHEKEKMRVIMLTAYHEREQVIYAIRAGASAYCAKDISPEELVNVIRAVAGGIFVVEGKHMTHPELEEWIHSEIERILGPHADNPTDQLIPLSPRETEILYAVTNGLSNKEISAKLGISQQTVKNHMTSILQKLNVEDRTQAAVKALKHGWVRMQQSKDS